MFHIRGITYMIRDEKVLLMDASITKAASNNTEISRWTYALD